jgi:hypothetical protein
VERPSRLTGDYHRKWNFTAMTPEQAKANVDFLNHEQPFELFAVGDSVYCLHCEDTFPAETVRRYFVKGSEFVGCPSPGCDGSPHDWFLA